MFYYWGLQDNIKDWRGWFLLILAIALLIFSIFLILYYFKTKAKSQLLREKTKDLSAGSFAGFWGRYRGAIILFSAVVLIIISIYFVYGSIFGYLPEYNPTWIYQRIIFNI